MNILRLKAVIALLPDEISADQQEDLREFIEQEFAAPNEQPEGTGYADYTAELACIRERNMNKRANPTGSLKLRLDARRWGETYLTS